MNGLRNREGRKRGRERKKEGERERKCWCYPGLIFPLEPILKIEMMRMEKKREKNDSGERQPEKFRERERERGSEREVEKLSERLLIPM